MAPSMRSLKAMARQAALSNAEGGPPIIQLDEERNGPYVVLIDPAMAAGLTTMGLRNSRAVAVQATGDHRRVSQ